MAQALALKYRPHKFEDVCSQENIVRILQNQISTNTFKQAYIFVGPAGCGKTTCARILANEINGGQGVPIELDAASNNSVDDIRKIGEQAKMMSLDSPYKVYILDEVHMLSGGAWAAMLKLIEEPPAKTIFILATTDVQKVPKTILSRCQRFDFTRIPHNVIKQRLQYVLDNEICEGRRIKFTDDAIRYIANIADGGMRTALTYTDKVLSYSSEVSIENVVEALGSIDYAVLFDLTDAIVLNDKSEVLKLIETIYMTGKDLKQFVKSFMVFMLDLRKYQIMNSLDYTQIPSIYLDRVVNLKKAPIVDILNVLMTLNADIKYESNAKALIEAHLLSIF